MGQDGAQTHPIQLAFEAQLVRCALPHRAHFVMLVLYETPAGYALFKTLDDSKLKNVDNIFKYFQDEEAAKKT